MNQIFQNAYNNNLEYIKSNHESIENKDTYGRTSLHHAVFGNAIEVINYIINYDKKLINTTDKYGETPIFDCMRKGKMDIAKILIMNNAKINIANNLNEYPLHLACAKGNLDMVTLLLESDSLVNIKTTDDKLPIHYAIKFGQSEILKYIINKTNQSWHQVDTYNNTLLHHATRTSNSILVKLILDNGVNPNILNDQFETPLFNAVRFSTMEVIKLLIDNNAFCYIKNRRFENPLELATIHEREDIFDRLKELIEIPKYERMCDKYSLIIAVLNRDYSQIRRLLEKGNILRKDAFKLTALDYAKKYQFLPCIALLKDIPIM